MNDSASSDSHACLGRVNVIVSNPFNPDDVFVGGSFKYAGGIECRCICRWDAAKQQWSSLMGGLSHSKAHRRSVAEVNTIVISKVCVLSFVGICCSGDR